MLVLALRSTANPNNLTLRDLTDVGVFWFRWHMDIYSVSVFLFILVLIYRYMWYQDDHIESYGYACVYIYIYVCKSAKKKDWLPKEKKHLFQRKQWLETDREETSKAVMAPCRNCQALWWKRAKLVLMVRRTIAITTHLPRFFLLWSMIVKGCQTFGDW